jgi:putative transposase
VGSDTPTRGLGKVVQIDEVQIKDHLGTLVKETVEETLNGLLDAEADELCQAKRYERSPDRASTRAGHYRRKLHTKAGEVTLRANVRETLTPFEITVQGGEVRYDGVTA